MDIGIRHLHLTVVIIFLVFLLFKTFLLLANKIELLDKIRSKTKILDMILGVLILATGAYLMTLKSQIEVYLWIKLVLVVAAIPLGILGLKNHKKPLALLSVLLIVYVYGAAETQSYKFKRDPLVISAGPQMGLDIYKRLCTECHGDDGKKALYKAPDLTASALSDAEKQERILQGKGIMRGYKELNAEQLEALMGYINTLK